MDGDDLVGAGCVRNQVLSCRDGAERLAVIAEVACLNECRDFLGSKDRVAVFRDRVIGPRFRFPALGEPDGDCNSHGQGECEHGERHDEALLMDGLRDRTFPPVF